jgi:hypothetical protein
MRRFPLIDQHRTNCCPKALAVVTEGLRTEAEVLDTCLAHGFNKRARGMYTSDMLDAARELGLVVTKIDTRLACGSQPYSAWGRYQEHYEMTLGEFCRQFKTGVFIVFVASHVLVVNTGVIVDPNFGSNHARRHVKLAYKVENSLLEAIVPERVQRNPLVRFVRTEFSAHPSRWGKESGITQRYHEAMNYAGLGKPVRLKDLLSNTQYRRGDFLYDLKHGNVELAKEE